MLLRKIIKIDEALCDGCGGCITACAEGAIELVNGKARIVDDKLCDGLGACIRECPTGALIIEEREAGEFDVEAARLYLSQNESCHVKDMETALARKEVFPTSPCSAPISVSDKKRSKRAARKLGPSAQLSSWPIQMRLAHPDAPYFKGASLLIAADCSAFASPSIPDFIKGKVILIGCPKLDETSRFVDKLNQILRLGDIKDIAVLHMEVPCCSNLVKLVLEALNRSGKAIALNEFICGIEGSIAKAGADVEQRRVFDNAGKTEIG